MTMNTTAAELIARCFAARTAAHIAHFRTRSYSAHMALQGFYEGIVGLVDDFAETHQGHFEVIDKYPEGLLTPSIYDDTTKTIESLCEWVQKHRDALAQGHDDLGNLADEITALCARTVYKLKNLK